VLAVLGDGEESMWATFHAAVDLADAAHARLTLVKTCEQGRSYVWIAPFAVGSAYLPPDVESPDEAAQMLARVAEHVPRSIPVTTLVLTAGTRAGLLRVLRAGHFGAIVAEEGLLSHCRGLRRQLRQDGILTVPVPQPSFEQPAAMSAAGFSSGDHTPRRRWRRALGGAEKRVRPVAEL
jgi:hypothetical protein